MVREEADLNKRGWMPDTRGFRPGSDRLKAMIREAACLVTRGWMPRSERLGAFIREAVGLDKRGCRP